MATNGGGHDGAPNPRPGEVLLGGTLSAMQQAVHDAMMEELGIGRKDTLPLQDRGPPVNLTPLPRLQSDNPWANAVFDDVDPATAELDSIADGQLYRLRRGASYGQHAPAISRCGRHAQELQTYTGGPSRRGQPSVRGGHSYASRGGRGVSSRGRPPLQALDQQQYSNYGGRVRGNIASRIEATIASLRSQPSEMAPQAFTRGRTNHSRGNRGEHHGTSRQRRPPPQASTLFNIENSSPEAFMASVNLQARIPASTTPPVSSSLATPSRNTETGKVVNSVKKGSGLAGSRFASPPRNPQLTVGQPASQSTSTSRPTPRPTLQQPVDPPPVLAPFTSSRNTEPVKSDNIPKKMGTILNSRWNPNPPPLQPLNTVTSAPHSAVQSSVSAPLTSSRNAAIGTHKQGSIPGLASLPQGEQPPCVKPELPEFQSASTSYCGPQPTPQTGVQQAPQLVDQAGPQKLVPTDTDVAQKTQLHDVLKQMSGIRLRLRSEDRAQNASYRFCRDIASQNLRLQCKMEGNSILDINDPITDKTTLYVNIDNYTVVTYCADFEYKPKVWLIIFSLPHEASAFQSFLLPEGGRNLIPELPESDKTNKLEAKVMTKDTNSPSEAVDPIQDAPSTRTSSQLLIDVEVDGGKATLINLDDEEFVEEVSTKRSAMMDLASLNVGMIDGIFEVIDNHPEGPFLQRLLARTSDIYANSAAEDIYNSIEALDAAEDLARAFFRNSQLFSLLNEEEEAAYIGDISPRLLEKAVEARDSARASAKQEKYTTEQLLDLRKNATTTPSFKFTPTREREPTKFDYQPVTKPPSSTPQTWQLFVANVKDGGNQHFPDSIPQVISDVEVARILASGPESRAPEPGTETKPTSGIFGDPELIVSATATTTAGAGLKTELDKPNASKFHVPTNSDVDRLGLAFGSLAVNAQRQPALSWETPSIPTDSNFWVQKGNEQVFFKAPNIQKAELTVEIPPPKTEKPNKSVSSEAKVSRDFYFHGLPPSSTSVLATKTSEVTRPGFVLSMNTTHDSNSSQPQQKANVKEISQKSLLSSVEAKQKVLESSEAQLNAPQSSGVVPSHVFIQEKSSISNTAAVLEARKKNGLANLSMSRFSDEPSSEKPSPHALHEKATTMERQDSPSIVAPSKVCIQEKPSHSEAAELKVRKKRGTAELSKSKWATTSSEISPKREIRELMSIRPDVPLFQRPRSESSRHFTRPTPAAQLFNPIHTPVNPIPLHQPQMTTVLVVNPNTGLMERVTGINENSFIDTPFPGYGLMSHSSSMVNVPVSHHQVVSPRAGELFPATVPMYQGPGPDYPNHSRPPLSPVKKENVQAHVQERLKQSLAAKKGSMETTRCLY